MLILHASLVERANGDVTEYCLAVSCALERGSNAFIFLGVKLVRLAGHRYKLEVKADWPL